MAKIYSGKTLISGGDCDTAIEVKKEVKRARGIYDSLSERLKDDDYKISSLELNKADKSMIGSPLVASSISDMTDTSKVYVNNTDGNWYYNNGSAWVVGGVYNSQGIGDGTITEEKTTFLDVISEGKTEDIKNLVDNSKIIEGKYWSGTVTQSDNSKYACYDLISIEPGKTYTVSKCVDTVHTFLRNQDNNGGVGTLSDLSITINSDGTKTFTNSSNAYYIRISGIPIEDMKKLYLCEGTKIPSDSEKRIIEFPNLQINSSQIVNFDDLLIEKILEYNGVKINKITVSTAEELKTALDEIATSADNNKATATNRYWIYLNSGTYELYDVLDKTDIKDQTLFKRGLEIPDYVDLIGIGNVVISCTLPDTETSEHVQAISALNTYGENKFKNLIIKVANGRYCVHDDDGGAYKNRTIQFENCILIHEGNTIGSWTSQECYGAGYTGGRHGIFKNCYFYSKNSLPFYIHNSAPYWATDIFTVEIDSCAFRADNFDSDISIQGYYNTGLKNIITIKNCNLDKKLRFNGDYNEFIVYGGGNNDFDITNTANVDIRLAGNHIIS